MTLLTQDEYPIVELLIREKVADNQFRAAHIVKGCKLAELGTDEARLARARLYRDWRNSQIYGKKTEPCYEMAIKGEAVPVEKMFDGDRSDDEYNGWQVDPGLY